MQKLQNTKFNLPFHKILLSIILKRLNPQVEEILSEEQADSEKDGAQQNTCLTAEILLKNI